MVIGYLLLLGVCTSLSTNVPTPNAEDATVRVKDKILIDRFLSFISVDQKRIDKNLAYFEDNWQDSYKYPLIEMLRFVNFPEVEHGMVKILKAKTGVDFGTDFFLWLQWLWKQEPNYPRFYGDLKAELYQNIDDKFRTYFQGRQKNATIRLDEIVWGGVIQDGIPPLRFPKYQMADEANYLSDSDVVFGFSLNGISRAYPKRILAWHEFFVDKFGALDIAGVYCTLCGTVIAYDMNFNGIRHDLGTSGFLYRSNKLMYDRATQSLWNTIEGRPVLGPLVDKGIELKSYYVVTTTWGKWKEQHPETQVLSLNTGHTRDYREGVAYQEYFGTQDLMFPVPKKDDRLDNKDEVLVVRTEGYESDPLAIDINFLKTKRVLMETVSGQEIVILTDEAGASRVYADADFGEIKLDGSHLQARDKQYEIREDGIYLEEKKVAERLPAHNIFWFAWYNAYPNTRLRTYQ